MAFCGADIAHKIFETFKKSSREIWHETRCLHLAPLLSDEALSNMMHVKNKHPISTKCYR